MKVMDIDLDIQFKTSQELKACIVALRREVRYMRDQRLDDLCWIDFYRLFSLLPEGIDGKVDMRTEPKEVMLHYCGQYIDCLKACPNPAEAERIYKKMRLDTDVDGC